MYENTNSSIDWKGIFLKLIIAFLIIAIVVTGVKMFNGGNNTKLANDTIGESEISSSFTVNIDKLKEAGQKYYKEHTDKLPKDGITSMVTLNDLIASGVITSLTDADGKACDGESSYVTAVKTGEGYTIKANLVCGESYSSVTEYLGENDAVVKQETSVNGSVINNTNSGSNSNASNTSNNCGSSCTPVISTKTEIKNNISINDGNKLNNNTSNNNNTYVPKRTYIVSYDKNGGSCYYPSYYVNEGEYAKNPGNCYKSGYDFIGWYLDGSLYNFNTPVTRDIKLVARYTRSYGYYEDDYNYNYDYGYDYDYDYGYNYGSTNNNQLTTTVYSIAWDQYGTRDISVNHTLRVPEDLRYKSISRIRIAKVEFADGITVQYELDRYANNFSKTFIYQSNGWEASLQPKNLADITNAYFTSYSTKFVDYNYALNNGFNITWNTSSISSQCRNVFSKRNNGTTVDNLCGYGISYKVTWEYEYAY